MSKHEILSSANIDGKTRAPHRQLAALCYREGEGGRKVLLVTSSEGRWILPKGWPIDGLRSSEAALVEAWEEGGVKKGKVQRRALGSFVSAKRLPDGDEIDVEVRVFAVKVKKAVKDYPEADRRDRRWVSPKKAARMVTPKGLREILNNF